MNDPNMLMGAGPAAGPAGPPPSITIPGGPPGGDTGADTPPSSGDDLVNQALDLLRQAAAADDLDHDQKLMVEKMTTMGQQMLTDHQKLTDQAMGGGPAAKLVRRHTLKQKAGGGGGGGY